ncbi:MAG: FecR family protein [Flavobacteriaceae bacterium]
MKRKQAKKLLDKYMNGQCSSEELELLEKFLESFQKKDQAWPESEYGSSEELREKMLSVIKRKIDVKKKSKRQLLNSYLKYAAIFIVLLSSIVFFQNSDEEKQGLIISDEAIVLKLGNNEIKKINANSGQSFANADGEIIGTQSGSQLTYIDNKVKELIYNEIYVPYGKKFQLKLSDGTFVYLNAGTSLKYPVNFISGKERQVFLTGEAYFEVAKDTKHPFIVHANGMGVKVLGTHFNVNTYKASEPFTVLVEGSVAIYQNKIGDEQAVTRTILPGQKASLKQNNIEIGKVNVSNYIGWMEGSLIFIDLPFIEIIQKIERKYNVKINNSYAELNNIKFKGRFEDESIIDLMNVFKESVGFDYQIINNEIILTKP